MHEDKLKRALRRFSVLKIKFKESEGTTIYGTRYDKLSVPSFIDLDTTIKWVLDSANQRPTTYLNGNKQCHAGAARSAVDTWRLINHYYPDEKISLASVMRAMYRLSMNYEISSSFCTVVMKRVFCHCSFNDVSDETWSDEFALNFNQWSELDE